MFSCTTCVFARKEIVCSEVSGIPTHTTLECGHLTIMTELLQGWISFVNEPSLGVVNRLKWNYCDISLTSKDLIRGYFNVS